MKVLWVSNSPIGPAAGILGETYSGSSGGWISTEYQELDKSNIEFCFLSSLPTVRKGSCLKKENSSGVVYCVHTPKVSYGVKCDKKMQKLIQSIINEIKPDVIHIWGTETWISNAVANVDTKAAKIVFLQGLIGVHQRYLGGYLGSNKYNKFFCSDRNPITNVKNKLRSILFKRQADIEKQTILLCKNVLLDSNFAQSYCASISDEILCFYHKLLPNQCFYKQDWSYNLCEKNSIFTIYGSNSEKGTQNLFWAVYLLKNSFKNIKVYIPGNYKLDGNGELLPSVGDTFQNTLYKMIDELSLKENIVFTGKLSAEQMARTMAKCNVFVNTSCMEVHALSLREAMVVGLPCITSLCGSVSEYVKDGENGLIYRYEEYEVLASYIKKLLTDAEYSQRLSNNAKRTFRNQDPQDIPLNEIYNKLTRR